MPKVVVTNKAGLVQEKGSGGIKVVHASMSGSAGTEGLRTAAGGSSGFLHMVQGEATMINGDTATTINNLIPVGSTVLCGKLAVTTAATSNSATSVGVTGDLDAFSGTISLDLTAVGSQVLSPTALMPTGVDNSDSEVGVIVTHGDPGDSTGVIQLSLLLATAATSEG
jgi:hypothetical protein